MESTNTPSLFELDARFRALVMQRNSALDECVLLAGENATLRAQVAALTPVPEAPPVPVPAAPAESSAAE